MKRTSMYNSVPNDQTRRRVGYALGIANLIGAVVVFLYTAFVVEIPGVAHQDRLTAINAAVFVPLILLGGWIGGSRILRRLRTDVDWLVEGREPTMAQREALLRLPLSLQRIVGSLWVVPVVVFAALNAPFSVRVALYVAVAIALGGLVTCAIGYLLAERLMRPLTAAALADAVPESPQLPGVAARAVLSWTLGSGVLLLALTLLAAAALGQRGISTARLAISVIVLCAIAIAVGLVLASGFARSLSLRIRSLREAASAVGRGELEHEVTVDDGSEVGLLQADFNQMLAGLRERERLRDLFGRQVGEDVVRHALERGVELGGEARDAAILFIDLEGSTAMASERDPAEVVALLNAFFGIVVEVVAAHRGWVNKFEGDGALCVFGAPLADEHPADHALAAARELTARLEAELPGVRAGIGVSAGRVVAGNVGASRRFEYTVIGDPVNEAARLSDRAKSVPERLLASSAAVDRATDQERRHWHPGESLELRGRTEPTRTARPERESAGTAPSTSP